MSDKIKHTCGSEFEFHHFSWWRAYYAALASGPFTVPESAHRRACDIADMAFEKFRLNRYGEGE